MQSYRSLDPVVLLVSKGDSPNKPCLPVFMPFHSPLGIWDGPVTCFLTNRSCITFKTRY